jgi:pimeloyl-ACP methyl ester carboxylesterase
MKSEKYILKIIAICALITVTVSSCQKSEDQPAYDYFVSKELVAPFTKTYINGLIDNVSGSIPEVAFIKPLVISDVNIYKMVYNTTVDGKKIVASGLICVPSTPGEYPILSFQNGTNTLNANAPSEYPLNYSYQLIELLASTGFVVLIADYPGFGESVSIPHPYLIREPTVQSLVDMLFAAKEAGISDLPGISVKNECYLLGYSQGGWATLALHKALELDYNNDFVLRGSACGAGPYNISLLLSGIVNLATYPQPYYLGYILNAYSYYGEFTNPLSDLFKEPYAARVSTMYNGTLGSEQINNQLTTSVADLVNADFLSGYSSSAKYSSVRSALENNSITAWHGYKPLLLLHGSADLDVNPISTENMYSAMLQAGTSGDLCKKVIIPDVNHGQGVVPCMLKGIKFLTDIKNSNQR